MKTDSRKSEPGTLVRKAARIAGLIVAGSLLLPSAAQAQLGASVGYGLNLINNPNFSGPGNTFESPGGLNASLFYTFPIGRFDIRPGVSVQKNDFSWDLEDVDIFSPLEADFRVASIPMDVRYRFSGTRSTPYVLVGPQVNYVAANRAELRTVLDYGKGSTRFTSINLGAGYKLNLPSAGLSLEPELRYSFALQGFMKEDYIVRTVEYDGDRQLSMNTLSFRVGVAFLGFN